MVHEALIFIPYHNDYARYWMVACWSYCMRHDYKPIAIVHDWADVVTYIMAGHLPVIVSARRDHLPCDRLPRFEAVSEEPAVPARPVPQRVRRQR